MQAGLRIVRRMRPGSSHPNRRLNRWQGFSAALRWISAVPAGEFAVAPDCLAGDLAAAYGFSFASEENGQRLDAVLANRLGRPAVVGDRIGLGGFVLIVREMEAGGRIVSIGLKCPQPEAPPAGD